MHAVTCYLRAKSMLYSVLVVATGYGPFVCLTTSPALTGMMVMVEDDRQGTLAAAERNLMAAGMMGLSFPLGMQASGESQWPCQ
jgi:hypothetical protein